MQLALGGLRQAQGRVGLIGSLVGEAEGCDRQQGGPRRHREFDHVARAQIRLPAASGQDDLHPIRPPLLAQAPDLQVRLGRTEHLVLPNPLPTGPIWASASSSGHKKTPQERGFLRCRRRDSNPRHADYDSAALTD